MIYLDNHATTPVHPEVLEAMLPFLRENFHNPSAGYRAGKKTRAAIETARAQVADLIEAKPSEITFTGCGTESNNMVLKSLARLVGRKNSRVITSAIEHSAVLRPVEAMAAVGFETSRIPVTPDGRLDLPAFEETCAATENGFVSLMWANNESGVIQPVAEALEISRRHGLPFHTDAIQAVGKIPLSVRETPVDFLSLSGHKFHAPKGVGALYIREGARFEPLTRGGGQESGNRAGTENVPYLVGLGKAAELMKSALAEGRFAAVGKLRDVLEQRLLTEIEGVTANGSRIHRVPTCAHLSFKGCEGAGLLILLDEKNVQVATGSACMTGKQAPSHVQKAMGLTDLQAKSSLRLSLSLFTTEEEIHRAADLIKTAVQKLRAVQGPPGIGPVTIYS